MRIAISTKNGMVYRDATPEEIAEFERQQAEIPKPEPSLDDRVKVLESTKANRTEVDELNEALNMILEGVTE